MHIVFMSPGAAPTETSGGRGHYVEKMSRVLVARGHDVSVIHESECRTEARVEGVHFIGVPASRGSTMLGKVIGGRLPVTRRSLGFGLAARSALRRIGRQGAVDVAIVMNNQASGLMVQLLAGMPPVVLRCMGYMPTYNTLKGRRGVDYRVIAELERRSVRTAPWVYAPTQLTASLYQPERANKSTVRVIRTPLDPDFGSFVQQRSGHEHSRPRRLLFFTAHLEELKGIFVLAEAFRELGAADNDLTMTVVGHNQRTQGWMARERMLELAGESAERIRFEPYVGRDKLRDLILAADVVVLPSLFDNLPNTLIESLQLGAIVVGTRGASFDEIIDEGESGFLAEPGSIESLVSAIGRALESANDIRIRQGALSATSVLAPEVVAADLENFLQEVLDSARGKRSRWLVRLPRFLGNRKKGSPVDVVA